MDDCMSYSDPKELIRARKLIEEAKFEEALQLVNEFGEKKDLSSDEQISYYTLKSILAGFFFNKIECLEYAEKAYHASGKLENSLLLLDVYIQMANGLGWHLKTNEANEFIQKSEELLKILPQEPSTELIKRRATIMWLKGYQYRQRGDYEKEKEFAELALKLREELDLKVDISFSLIQL